MARGRKSTPANLKLVRGNPGKREIEQAMPQPEVLFMAPPDHLPELAAGEWIRLMPELVKWGLITRLDCGALEAYCSAYGQWRRATRMLKKSLCYETTGRNGTMRRARPEIAIANEALRQMARFGSEFGLTPSARIRLKGTAQGDMFPRNPAAPEPAKPDAFDAL